MTHQANSCIAAEVAQFEAVGGEWWDERGPFKPLHMLNPVRMEYLVGQIARCCSSPPERDSATGGEVRRGGDSAPIPLSKKFQPLAPRASRGIFILSPCFAGARILDIACGGGLVAEPLARLGANVTGIDTSANAIAAARAHAAVQGLEIDYRVAALEEFSPRQKFDVITALEIIEHVAKPAEFVRAAARLLKPGGIIIFSTINRTVKSLLLAKIAAEDILRWVPRGTHDWNKFVQPAELADMCSTAGLRVSDITGLTLNPLRAGAGMFALTRDVAVNYFLTAQKNFR